MIPKKGTRYQLLSTMVPIESSRAESSRTMQWHHIEFMCHISSILLPFSLHTLLYSVESVGYLLCCTRTPISDRDVHADCWKGNPFITVALIAALISIAVKASKLPTETGGVLCSKGHKISTPLLYNNKEEVTQT